MSKKSCSPEQIDALLPQTQCGLCGYGGCMPYAEALANQHAAIDLCPPGGVQTMLALANLLAEDATPYLESMTAKAKPPSIAAIQESACIGCTKCIQACPVDAIIGAAKQMHTVFTAACTGCELCIPSCPVDCIEIVAREATLTSPKDTTEADEWRRRFQQRQIRLAKQTTTNAGSISSANPASISDKQAYIADALARIRAKKSSCTNG